MSRLFLPQWGFSYTWTVRWKLLPITLLKISSWLRQSVWILSLCLKILSGIYIVCSRYTWILKIVIYHFCVEVNLLLFHIYVQNWVLYWVHLVLHLNLRRNNTSGLLVTLNLRRENRLSSQRPVALLLRFWITFFKLELLAWIVSRAIRLLLDILRE
jgi:hypothetical protein